MLHITCHSGTSCRFPGADALRSELENFVAKHAKRPGLHTLPEAASLLATPAAAKSGTDTLQTLQNWAPAPLLQACTPLYAILSRCATATLGDVDLRQQACTVSAPLTCQSWLDVIQHASLGASTILEYDGVYDQALVMMGGPAGRVPAVREYALRSLQACNPDQVILPASVLIMEAPLDDSVVCL